MKFTRPVLLQQEDVRITGNDDFLWSFEADNVNGASVGTTAISDTTTTGSGTGATFDLTITKLTNGASRINNLVVTNAGTGYAAGDVITIPMAQIPNSSGGDVKIKLNAKPDAPATEPDAATSPTEKKPEAIGTVGLIVILVIICVLCLILALYGRRMWDFIIGKIFGKNSQSELFQDIEVSSIMTNLSQL